MGVTTHLGVVRLYAKSFSCTSKKDAASIPYAVASQSFRLNGLYFNIPKSGASFSLNKF
ncbi:hypothetical protein [Neotamlana sedimentorum]|uniref:hypothetical protein n=1 Tax=Neotamlana sedimentorum TaxID=1435349 RepID=UPI000AE936C2|nr:hypothetical protein [Tamlana sedimentorum]